MEKKKLFKVKELTPEQERKQKVDLTAKFDKLWKPYYWFAITIVTIFAILSLAYYGSTYTRNDNLIKSFGIVIASLSILFVTLIWLGFVFTNYQIYPTGKHFNEETLKMISKQNVYLNIVRWSLFLTIMVALLLTLISCMISKNNWALCNSLSLVASIVNIICNVLLIVYWWKYIDVKNKIISLNCN